MPGRLVFLVTEDWYFLSHRLPMARAAKDAGFDVFVATKNGRGEAAKKAIEDEGFTLCPIGLDRAGKNPFKEIASILEITRAYRRIKPDIVHHVALKPTLYGSVAARLAGVKGVVNAMAGLGAVFIGSSAFSRLIRPFVTLAFRFLLNGKHARLIVQNDDDLAFFAENGLIEKERIVKITGSGVDTNTLKPVPEPDPPVTAVLVGRMLFDKGVAEFADAARILKEKGENVRCVLAGTPDPANPRSIPEKTLEAWVEDGLLDWRGHVDDISGLWAAAHIAVLPSYREGLPKSLAEAAACGRPMITADVPGCREIVKDGENGRLVPVKNGKALADAIQDLSRNAEKRRKMGANARKTAEEILSAENIGKQTRALYREIFLSHRPGE